MLKLELTLLQIIPVRLARICRGYATFSMWRNAQVELFGYVRPIQLVEFRSSVIPAFGISIRYSGLRKGKQ
jgi:phosphoribosylaminoimidazole-succinocarboxamide synthase